MQEKTLQPVSDATGATGARAIAAGRINRSAQRVHGDRFESPLTL